MKLNVNAVYDQAVGAYATPFFTKSRGEAVRSWLDVCNDPKSQMFIHPTDFTLLELGVYDDSNGTFENHQTPISLGTALEMKSKETTHPARQIRQQLDSIANETKGLN